MFLVDDAVELVTEVETPVAALPVFNRNPTAGR
jgi:hypothetical protein